MIFSSAETTMSGAAANGAIPKVEQNPKKEMVFTRTDTQFSVKMKSFFSNKKYVLYSAFTKEISARVLFPPSVGLLPAALPAP